MSSFFLFCSLLIFNQACQFKSLPVVMVKDVVRESHAEELLVDRSLSSVKAFDGDNKFPEYISKFVKRKNKKIDAEQFTRTLMEVSDAHSYDPIFLLAVITTESDFNFNARGSAGEIGLMQLKPDTAEWICNKSNIEWKGAQALKDPEYNILVGSYYFQYLKSTLKSKSMKYVNAYNLGLTSLQRMPAAGIAKHPYFGKVIKNYLTIYSDLKKIKDKKETKRS